MVVIGVAMLMLMTMAITTTMVTKTDMYPALQLRVAWVRFRAMEGGGASGESPGDHGIVVTILQFYEIYNDMDLLT